VSRVLNERQLRLYSRQVILRELGQAGQAQLCAARVAAADSSSAGATSVALDYLERAGMQVLDAPAEGVLPLAVLSADEADPALQACAEWLHGAWAAVETIKQCTGVGSPALAAPPSLTAEVD
jgi:hypothetical protein